MWARNLLFIGLVLGGFAALRASLFPLNAPTHPIKARAQAAPPSDREAVVADVNNALQQQWDKQRLTHASPADELIVARRLSLALTGTIPSLEEIRQFEKRPPEQRLDWYVDHLLADRRFGDYWGERLARAYVGTEDGPFLVYRRRRFVTWISDQLMVNRGYGAMVADLITTDGLWTDHPATNFITVTNNPATDNPDPERLAARVTRAFLGLRIDCAQCHNHPFESWKQTDFHGLAAFFGQVHKGLTGIHDQPGDYWMENRKTGGKEVVGPAVPFNAQLLPSDGSNRTRLARWITHPENEHFSRAAVQRVWALLFGRPLLDSVESMSLVENPPPVLAVLAKDFTAHNYDLGRLIRIIVASKAFQLESAADFEVTDDHEKGFAVFPMVRLRPEQVVDSVQQAATVTTVSNKSNIFTRLTHFTSERDFVKRYGDTGEDEFDGRSGTIPQRLLLMNGTLVKEKTQGQFTNAATQIATLASTDQAAVEAAYLSVLTRRPTPDEQAHFTKRLEHTEGPTRNERLEDLYWTLINSTEFSWNH